MPWRTSSRAAISPAKPPPTTATRPTPFSFARQVLRAPQPLARGQRALACTVWKAKHGGRRVDRISSASPGAPSSRAR
jgi:hypothetical protein